MKIYLFQDLCYLLAGLFLTGLVFGYAFFKQPCFRLVTLTILFLLAGVTDVLQVYGVDPTQLLLTDSVNVACALFSLTFFLQFSLLGRSDQRSVWPTRVNALFFLPALLLAMVYTLTPLLIGGITTGANGFRLDYQPGFWLLVLALAGGALMVLWFVWREFSQAGEGKARERAVILLFSFLLAAYFYGTGLILPFLAETGQFASPLPLTFAALVLVYANVKYGYFSD
jgi:hypothetical protein